MTLSRPRAVLFDLDGTLADTAPDLAAATNLLRIARGLEPTPYEKLRAMASAGGRGLLGAAFGITPEDEAYPALLNEFLDNYQAAMAVHTRLFDGVETLLQALRECDMRWGIVTNKHMRFTDSLVLQIGLHEADCVISGDTTPFPKPHPEPMFEAARRLALPPEACWYVGDDLRDIQAGRAAGMRTIAAGWGYCVPEDMPSWEADWIAETPMQLMELMQRLK
ncbi:MAG: HAD family hydrolase [Oxalobacter sp.]|nr:MAG: HAD family hydrolase [Oxalobacter sp.]